MLHELKQDIQFWDDMIAGLKDFEIRKADRHYNKGDRLELRAVGKCCHYCDGVSYKSYYRGVCSGWQNCFKEEADVFTELITEVITPEEYNKDMCNDNVNATLADYFKSDKLMDDYVLLRVVALPRL